MTEENAKLDAVLIARVRAGDDEAFGLLCGRYSARLKARVRRQLTPAILRKVSVSDILQEAHIAALERFADFENRGEGSFGHWLARIVENKVLHAARRYRGTAKRGGAAEVSRGRRVATGHFIGPGPSPSEVAMALELKQRVRQAVASLPQDYREVIRLRQEEHRSIRETAARMRRSPDAIKMLYGRALARLALLLDISEEES